MRRRGPAGLHPGGRRSAANGAKGTREREGHRHGKQRGACRQASPTRGDSESNSQDTKADPDCTGGGAPQAPDKATGAPSTDRAPPGRSRSREGGAVKRARRRSGPTGLHPDGRRAAPSGAEGPRGRKRQRRGKGAGVRGHMGTVDRGRQAPDEGADTTGGGSGAGLATHTDTATKDHAHTPEAPEVVKAPQGAPNKGTGATQTDRAPPGRSQSR